MRRMAVVFPRLHLQNSNMLSLMSYNLAGLRIVSEMPLPGLIPCRKEISASDGVLLDAVLIRRGHVPEFLSPLKATFWKGQWNDNEFLLNTNVARYLISGGKEILIDQAPGSDHDDVCAYLLGTVFGILCYQRGVVPLHASAIDAADGFVAFVGHPGAGKSTLAAALARRGHQVIADDVCYVRVDDNGVVRAWPGVNRIRLRDDAMAVFGGHGSGVQRERRAHNKYRIPIRPAPSSMKPRRLRRVYALEAAPDAGAANVSQICGVAALEVLMQNVYRLNLAAYMGYKPTAFVVCAAAARDVSVFRFSRRREFDALDETVRALENHLLT
jgi:hypothetical protein